MILYITNTTGQMDKNGISCYSFRKVKIMKDIDISTLDSILHTVRIELNEEEKNQLLPDLEKILDYAHLLDQLDLSGIQPCYHVVEDVFNVMRPDIPENTLSRDDFLQNAPDQIGGMLKVPSIIED